MTRSRVSSGFVALSLLAAAIACGFSVSTARITNAFMATDPDGDAPVQAYFPEETFYLIVDVANAPDDTQVRAVWTAVDVEDTDPDTVIDEAELETSDGRLTFDLTNNDLWPAGLYKVDIYLNDALERTLEFEVQN
jgi:hypothetical protein